MKTSKKVISLVLALVMVIGLVVVGNRAGVKAATVNTFSDAKASNPLEMKTALTEGLFGVKATSASNLTGVYFSSAGNPSYMQYLTENNLRFVGNASTTDPSVSINANFTISSKKWYWEVEALNYAANGNSCIGIGSNGTYIAYLSNRITRTGSEVSYGGPIKSGDIVSVLFDDDSKTLEYWVNGVSQGKINISMDAFGKGCVPYISVGFPYIDMRANFGATQFKYANKIPSGYLPYSVAEPINLNGNEVSGKANLSWNSIGGATGYNVYKADKTGGPYTLLTNSPITSTTYTDSASDSGNFYYIVRATANGAEAMDSNEVSITTKIEPIKLVLETNKTKQLSVTDDLSDNGDMTWTSSDESIATVDGNGLVKALKPGNTVITCKSKDGTYTETINVLVVDLNYQLAVDLTVGDKCRLTVDDLANTANVTWKVDNPKIATVSSTGKVTAISEGLTYVTATDSDGKEVGRIFIRVSQQ